MESKHEGVVVGVDAGGSSTRALVVGRDGTPLGYAVAGPGNPTSSGRELVATHVVDAVSRALDAAGAESGSAARIAVAMAGASTTSSGWLAAAAAAAGVGGEVVIEADLAAIYLSGTRARLGYAVLAGTGAIAARLRDHRIDAVSDGVGWLLGDEGSGFWIGHRVVRAAAAELDGRGDPTSLTAAVLESLDLPTERGIDVRRPDALDRILADAYGDRPVRLARFAPAAFAAAAAGDTVAIGIVADAALRLAGTLGAVIGEDRHAPVVLGGSVLAGQPIMADAVRGEIGRHGVSGEVIVVPDGVTGAAVLALEGSGITVDEVVAARIEGWRASVSAR